MLLKVRQRKFIDILVAIILILAGLFNMNSNNIFFVACLTLLVSIYNLILARKSIFHFIIFGFILFSNYSICISQYINPVNNIYTSLTNTRYGCISICILLIFNAGLLLFYPSISSSVDYSEKILSKDNSNTIIVLGAIVLALLIFVVGFGRPDEAGARGEVSAYYEYAILIFLMGFLYCGNNKFFKIILIGIAAMYCIQDLIYGGRITSLQLIIMIYLVFFHDKKLNLVKLAPIAFFGVLLFSAVGEMRGDFDFSITSLVSAFKSLFDGSFSLDTAYAAFYASQIFVKVAWVESWGMRLANFGAFLGSIVLGSSDTNSNLSVYTQSIEWHGGGGVTPFYMYYYLGITGVFITVIYLSFLIKKFNWEASNFSKAFMIYITYTVPRWYLYSNVSLLRGLLIFMLVFAICKQINSFTKINVIKYVERN